MIQIYSFIVNLILSYLVLTMNLPYTKEKQGKSLFDLFHYTFYYCS